MGVSDSIAAGQRVLPRYDSKDQYRYPAFMPSSADRTVKSFDPAEFVIPTAKQEDWQYAPLERIGEFFEPFRPSGETQVRLSFLDGSGAVSAGSDASVSFERASRSDPLPGSVGKPSDRAAALEWDCVQQIYALDVRRDLDQPLLLDVRGTGEDLDALHVAVRFDPGVHATLVIDHRGLARLSEGFEISVGENAVANVISIQEWDAGAKHLGSQRIRVDRSGRLNHSVVTLSGGVVRLRMDPDFGGPDGYLNMLGVYFVDPGEYVEHRTMVVHNHPSCTSRVVYKGALNGKDARSAWVGNALILPQASQTDSYELNRNLVLMPGAVAESEPQLEIENGNIVGAGHASSVGRFDDGQLFYMRSRGIPESAARKLVVHGFFSELVEEIGIPAVSEHLMATIDRRLAMEED